MLLGPVRPVLASVDALCPSLRLSEAGNVIVLVFWQARLCAIVLLKGSAFDKHHSLIIRRFTLSLRVVMILCAIPLVLLPGRPLRMPTRRIDPMAASLNTDLDTQYGRVQNGGHLRTALP